MEQQINTPGQNQKPNRFKRTLLRLLLALVFLILLLIGLAYVFEDKIKAVVVSAINQNLKTKVEVSDIHFSLIRKFPYATLQFNNLLARPVKPFNQTDTLLYAEKFFMMFNVMDLIDNSYNLKKVELNNAVLHLETDVNGLQNYKVWSDSTDNKTDFSLNLKDVILKNTYASWLNLQSHQHYLASINELKLDGAFSTNEFDLSGKGNMFIDKLKIGNDEFIKGKNAVLDLKLHVNTLLKKYDIQSSHIKIEGLDLTANGFIKTDPKSFIDLKLSSPKADVLQLLTLLPGSAKEKLGAFDVEGSLAFDASLKGFAADDEVPLIRANFSSSNSKLKPPHSSYELKNISFTGFYTNKKSSAVATSYLSLKNFRASLDEQLILANIEAENLNDPYVNALIDGTFDLKKMRDFVTIDTLESINGTVKINASLKGKIKSSTAISSQGTAELSNVSVKLKNSNTVFENFNGSFSLRDNELQVSSLKGKINGNELRIQGVITNALNYLFQKDAPLSIDADLVADKIDLNNIITEGNGNSSSSGIYFPPQLHATFNVSVNSLTYKKFEATSIRGTISLANGVLSTEALNLKTMSGSLALQGEIDASRKDSLLISYNADINKIDISRLFVEMGNFGQQTIQDKNIKGTVTASVQFASVWSQDLIVNPNSIYAKCNIKIENGELIDFKPMLSLSKFVKGSNLNDVKFETLSNTIEIKNRLITFPSMEIRSSALSLSASGTHTFDNFIDYKIKLELSELLGKRVKEMNTEFGTIEDDGYGHPKLYLSMKGPIDKPKITYDKKAVEDNIVKSIKQEKQNMKAVLNKEFGWFKKDSVVQKPKPKKDELQIDPDE